MFLKQYKFIKPVDTAIINLIPEGDLDLVKYLNEFLWKNNQDQQSNRLWFPTKENPGKTEDRTPITDKNPQKTTRLERERWNWARRMTQNIKENSLNNLIGNILCLPKLGNKQLILFCLSDIFARHTMDTGLNAEHKMKLIPKYNKLGYS